MERKDQKGLLKRSLLPPLQPKYQNSRTASQTYAKEVSRLHKRFEIARIHGIPTRKFLECDIYETNTLFDE